MDELSEEIENNLQLLQKELSEIHTVQEILGKTASDSEQSREALDLSLETLEKISIPFAKVAEKLKAFQEITAALASLPENLSSELAKVNSNLAHHLNGKVAENLKGLQEVTTTLASLPDNLSSELAKVNSEFANHLNGKLEESLKGLQEVTTTLESLPENLSSELAKENAEIANQLNSLKEAINLIITKQQLLLDRTKESTVLQEKLNKKLIFILICLGLVLILQVWPS